MGTINFSVPDDVKDAFNEVFSGQNKSAVIAALMREAVERAQRQQASRAAIERIVQRRSRAPLRGSEALERSRRKGRP